MEKTYAQIQREKDEALRNKPNQKLFRVINKYGTETEVRASCKKDARRLSKMCNIISIDAVG